jgi:RNA polymerase sigma factor FliA
VNDAAAEGEAGVRNDAFVYTPRGTIEGQDYVKQYAPLVRRLAHQMVARLPANVELDDMVQAGMMGLMDAVGRYEESQGTQFEHYAASRIRGAMLDELRANDWLPRSARKSQRDIENAIHRLEGKLKRAPTESEIARELNISVTDYQEMLNEARGAQLVYFDDLGGGGGDDEDYLERHVADTSEGGGDPGRIPARQALSRCAGGGHRRAARARAAADGHVLRAGHESARDRCRDGRDRVARVPAAQPGGGAAAQQAQALVIHCERGQGHARHGARTTASVPSRTESHDDGGPPPRRILETGP